MKLYFKRAELLLHQNADGEYLLEMGNVSLGLFKSQKQAISEYNKIRNELERELPPAKLTAADRRALLDQYLADNLLKHNSLRDTQAKKPPKSRTFG